MDRRTTAIVAAKNTQGSISAKLAEKLTLCAAEAVCGGIDDSAFAEFCAETYRNIKGGMSDEGA
jgi:sugar (pentulose or hexulose) kinase